MKSKEFTCERCSTTFQRRNGSRVYRFCSRSCAAITNAIGQRTYEDPRTYVTWIDDDGVKHTYIPDLFDVTTNTVYEVKPARFVASPTQEMIKKRAAVIASGRKFAYVSEKGVAA